MSAQTHQILHFTNTSQNKKLPWIKSRYDKGEVVILKQTLTKKKKFGYALGIFTESLCTKVTDPNVIEGMEDISTLIPAAILALSIICVIIYPMTRKRFNALMLQLEKKRNGEEYTTEGFEKLL